MNIIDLVRKLRGVEEGKLEISTYNLHSCFNESLEIMTHKIKDKEIDMDVHIDKKLSVNAERTSLVNSVFNNLLTNAIC